MDVVQQMGQFTPVKTFLATKGTQFRGTKVDAHIIVGTPGTILDMSRSRGVLDLSKLKVLVLDEADNMLDEGQMGDQSINVKKYAASIVTTSKVRANSVCACSSLIQRVTKNFQIVLFSATFPDEVRSYATRFAPNANEIRLKPQELTVDAIKQFFMGMCASFKTSRAFKLTLVHRLQR